jgi:hypothetical protein
MVELYSSVGVGEIDPAQWSTAEFRDSTFSVDIQLRAVICRLSAFEWQWMVLSIGARDGELISLGTANSATEARSMATSEITKCLEAP